MQNIKAADGPIEAAPAFYGEKAVAGPQGCWVGALPANSLWLAEGALLERLESILDVQVIFVKACFRLGRRGGDAQDVCRMSRERA